MEGTWYCDTNFSKQSTFSTTFQAEPDGPLLDQFEAATARWYSQQIIDSDHSRNPLALECFVLELLSLLPDELLQISELLKVIGRPYVQLRRPRHGFRDAAVKFGRTESWARGMVAVGTEFGVTEWSGAFVVDGGGALSVSYEHFFSGGVAVPVVAGPGAEDGKEEEGKLALAKAVALPSQRRSREELEVVDGDISGVALTDQIVEPEQDLRADGAPPDLRADDCRSSPPDLRTADGVEVDSSTKPPLLAVDEHEDVSANEVLCTDIARMKGVALSHVDAVTRAWIHPPTDERIRSLQKTVQGAVQRLAADLYSGESHFLLELLQNADDCEYSPEIVPTLVLSVVTTTSATASATRTPSLDHWTSFWTKNRFLGGQTGR